MEKGNKSGRSTRSSVTSHLMIPLAIAAGTLSMLVPEGAMAGGGLGNALNTFGTQFKNGPQDLEYLGYVAGAASGLMGLLNLKKHQDPESHKKGAIELGVGAGLLGFGYWMGQVNATAGGSSNFTNAGNLQ